MNADEVGRPTKVRKVDNGDDDGHDGGDDSQQDDDTSSSKDSNESDDIDGDRDEEKPRLEPDCMDRGTVHTWKLNFSTLRPIIRTTAWTDTTTPPVSPFFPDTDEMAVARRTDLERWVWGSEHNQTQIRALASPEVWVQIILTCDNMTKWELRSTCRAMMELCEKAVPALKGRRGRSRVDQPISRGNYPWIGLDEQYHEMKAQLNWRQFCLPCLEHRMETPREIHWETYQDYMLEMFIEEKDSGAIPVCEHLWATNSLLEEWWKEPLLEPLRIDCDDKPHDKYCKPAGMPAITLQNFAKNPGDNRKIVADLEWEVALVTLPCDEDDIPVKRLSYTDLRDLIRAAASKANADGGLPRLLCPHLSWKDHSLLRPFDPTVCCCLDGANDPMHGIQDGHDPEYCVFHHREKECCICQMAKCDKAGIFIPEGRVGGQYVGHKGCCSDCDTQYIWTRRFDAKTRTWKLWLEMKARMESCDHMSDSWLHRVDPAAFAQDEDLRKGLKHHSWCDDPECATSYRGRKNARLLLIEGEEWELDYDSSEWMQVAFPDIWNQQHQTLNQIQKQQLQIQNPNQNQQQSQIQTQNQIQNQTDSDSEDDTNSEDDSSFEDGSD